MERPFGSDLPNPLRCSTLDAAEEVPQRLKQWFWPENYEVEHPEEWECAGYHEIKQPPKRYARIDRERLASLLGLPNVDYLAGWQQESFTDAFSSKARARYPEWTESLAVGVRDYFMENVQTELGIDARHRSVEAGNHDAHVLREPRSSYRVHTKGKSEDLSVENTLVWDLTY